MKHILHILRTAALSLILAVSFTAAVSAQAPVRGPVWEVVRLTDPASPGTEVPEVSHVSVSEGVVTIIVERPVTVKVFSILGQLITQKQLQPGTHRLTLGTKGIYILKASDLTKRINL